MLYHEMQYVVVELQLRSTATLMKRWRMDVAAKNLGALTVDQNVVEKVPTAVDPKGQGRNVLVTVLQCWEVEKTICKYPHMNTQFLGT
jgi:hypothetical protein